MAAVIMKKIEVIDTDAAADEVAAARELKITEAFPNVKLLLKDPTHACTRRCLLKWDGCPGMVREQGGVVSGLGRRGIGWEGVGRGDGEGG